MSNTEEIDLAYVIMGGGVLENGNVPDHVKERCNFVLEQIKNINEESIAIIASSSFTLNQPPKLNPNGFIYSESSAIEKYIKKKLISISKIKIICEQFSHDTVGSLFFIEYIYVKNFNIKRLVIVSSYFHCERIEGIVNEMLRIGFFSDCKIEIKSSNLITQPSQYESRMKHEKQALNNFKEGVKNINTIKEYIRYLMINHSCMNHNYSGRIVSSDDFY